MKAIHITQQSKLGIVPYGNDAHGTRFFDSIERPSQSAMGQGTIPQVDTKPSVRRPVWNARRAIFVAGLLLALVIGGTLSMQDWSARSLPSERGPAFTQEAQAQRRALLIQMQEVASRMKDAKGTAEFDRLVVLFNELAEQYESIPPAEKD